MNPDHPPPWLSGDMCSVDIANLNLHKSLTVRQICSPSSLCPPLLNLTTQTAVNTFQYQMEITLGISPVLNFSHYLSVFWTDHWKLAVVMVALKYWLPYRDIGRVVFVKCWLWLLHDYTAALLLAMLSVIIKPFFLQCFERLVFWGDGCFTRYGAISKRLQIRDLERKPSSNCGLSS